VPQGLGVNVLSIDRWIYALAIVGLAQETCKYVAVRYTMYTSPEFDEPLDGIIYMSAAGIGFATFESLNALLRSGGEIYLSAAAAQCVVTTLAHASFAGVMGFAMGRAKFGAATAAHRSLTLLLGLIAAAALNGSFQMIMDALNVQGLDTSPWERVLTSFGFAAGVFIVTSILMQKLLAISPHSVDASSEASDE
jgi:RsiW-degrading membrane proteinase PrsW (M82 family)